LGTTCAHAAFLFVQILQRWASVFTALEWPESLVLHQSFAELKLFPENTSCGVEICEEHTPLSMWNYIRNFL